MRNLEQVHYELSNYDTGISLYHPVYTRLLKVLAKLPVDVYDYIIDKVHFSSNNTQMILTSDLIELEHTSLIILSKNDSQFTIAHEIAHAWLKHTSFLDSEREQVREKEANDQAIRWNIKRT